MKKEDFLSAVAEIDDDLLGDVASEEAGREKRRIGLPFMIVAACVIAAAAVLFAVSLGMRRPEGPPPAAGTDVNGAVITDQSDKDTGASATETGSEDGHTADPETVGSDTGTGSETDPGPTESETRNGTASSELPSDPAAADPDPGKSTESVNNTEDNPPDPRATDNSSYSADTVEDPPVLPPPGTDEPPVDPDLHPTLEDLCGEIYRTLEQNTHEYPPAPVPGSSGGTFNPEGFVTPGGASPSLGDNSQDFTAEEYESAWYYFNVVCGGNGPYEDALKNIAKGYASTPLDRGRMAKMLVDYLRYRIDADAFDYLFRRGNSILFRREYPGFEDVTGDTSYAEEIITAYEIGLIEPESDTRLGVSSHVTAEELNFAISFINDNFSDFFRY